MTDHASETTSPLSTQRLEALSDGVFAIAITLLILEIKIPGSGELQHQPLSEYLLKQWPKYFAYVFSFFIIGIYWANHHYIFRLYKRTNHVFNILNIIFLMTISFLPFPTAIFGEYINDAPHRSTAVSFYALGIFMPAVVWFTMWLYGSYKKRLIDHRLNDRFVNCLTRQFLISNIFYLLGLVISFFSPLGSIAVSVLMTLVYLLPPKKPDYT